MRNGTKPKSSRHLSMAQRRSFEALIFLAPWLIGLCLFFLRPILMSMRLSFSEITKMKGFLMEWRGLENYKYIFFYDRGSFRICWGIS